MSKTKNPAGRQGQARKRTPNNQPMLPGLESPVNRQEEQIRRAKRLREWVYRFDYLSDAFRALEGVPHGK